MGQLLLDQGGNSGRCLPYEPMAEQSLCISPHPPPESGDSEIGSAGHGLYPNSANHIGISNDVVPDPRVPGVQEPISPGEDQ